MTAKSTETKASIDGVEYLPICLSKSPQLIFASKSS